MKNRIKIIGLLLIFAGGLSSCKKKEDVTPTYTQPAVQNSLTYGEWTVSEFTVNGVEHSNFYDGYAFHFGADGMITAKSSDKKVEGKWSTNKENDKPNFILDFGTTDPFNLMNNEHWLVVKQTDVLLSLDAQRGDDGKQTLSFKRK